MSLQNNKSLGQHWLKDRLMLDEIADEALLFDDTGTVLKTQPECLEIGPGLGTLTSSLLKRFPKVTAVEFDPKLAHNLPNSFPGKNLEVINEDFLKFDFKKLPKNYVVAGNIPYYITKPIILKLLEAEPKPKKIVLLIQKEVAKQGFSNPRKKLIKNLPYERTRLEHIFSELLFDPNLRPSDLSHDEWRQLFDKIMQ